MAADSPERSLPPDDRSIARRLAAGDVGAHERLFDEYHHLLIRFAAPWLGSIEAAEDVVSAAFLALWRERATWGTVSDIERRLYLATRAELVAALRDAKLPSVYESPVLGAPHQLRQEEAEAGVDAIAELVLTAIDHLPARPHTLLLDHWRSRVAGLSGDVGTVAIREAIERLRRELLMLAP